MSKTRIMLADDHSLFREGIAALLKLHDDMEVVAHAENGEQAIQKAESARPDLILMDISMPGLGGLEATLEIKRRLPNIKILVLSQYSDAEYINRFLKAGVSGYILKKAAAPELIGAIRVVASGESYLYPSIASSVIEGFLNRGRDVMDPYDLLSDREKQVLKLIAEAKTHKEIASVLGISEKTVIAHQTKISDKLDIHSKPELMRYAYGKGIVRP